MDSSPTISASETIIANMRVIVRGLLAVLGAWRVEPVIACCLYGRINGIFSRIERLLLRFRAGGLRRVTQRQVMPGRKIGRKPGVVLPRRFGWLVLAGGYQAVGFGLQLQNVLTTPDMAELLAASAQARRILRPLCRALAVELPWVIDKPRKTKPRIRKPRPKPEPFRIPLPRGALSWARREGFGKMR